MIRFRVFAEVFAVLLGPCGVVSTIIVSSGLSGLKLRRVDRRRGVLWEGVTDAILSLLVTIHLIGKIYILFAGLNGQL
jgi:hypothetical protein